MKKMWIVSIIAVLAMASSAVAASSSAETAMEKLAKIFNKQPFSARVVMTMTGKNAMPGPMEFKMAMSGGNTRMEMDMSKMMGAAGGEGGMPPGMGKIVSIVLPAKKMMYQIMPDLKAYAEMQIPEAAGSKGIEAKIDRKVEGTEKIETYACEKVRNTVTTEDGKTQIVMTWEAKELKGLPVKVEMETPDGKVTMLYKDIKTDKPADSLFQPPAGFKKFASMQEMMMSVMMQNMGQ